MAVIPQLRSVRSRAIDFRSLRFCAWSRDLDRNHRVWAACRCIAMAGPQIIAFAISLAFPDPDHHSCKHLPRTRQGTWNISPAPSQSEQVTMGVCTYRKPSCWKKVCVAVASALRMRATAPDAGTTACRSTAPPRVLATVRALIPSASESTCGASVLTDGALLIRVLDGE